MNKGQINGLISPILERIRLRNIAMYIKGPKVLDVGCGRCALKYYLGSIEYYGLEKDKSISIIKDVKIFYCDVESDLESDLVDIGKYDSIVLSEIIEHLEHPKKVILNLKNHLDKNGIIIISTSIPLRYKVHRYTSKIGLTSKEASHEHKSFLGKAEIYKLAKDCDLVVKEYRRTELWTKQIVVYTREWKIKL